MGEHVTVPNPDGFTLHYFYVCERCGMKTKDSGWIIHADQHALEDERQGDATNQKGKP